MGAWARAGWRVWDLGNGTIILQKLFNPEWQITSKSLLLSSFFIGFSFSPTAEISSLELEFEESLHRKTASKRGMDRSQMEQPIKKNKFSYFARSRLRLRPQEIWERDYCLPCHIPDRWSRNANWIWPDLAFGFVLKRSGNEIILGQMINLDMIFYVAVSVYRLVKIWNSTQVPCWISERPIKTSFYLVQA